MKLIVTFKTKTGHLVKEMFDLIPHANGFVPDYKIRALALGWEIVKVEEI